MAEDFFDVPDVVENVVVARRDVQRVLLQWKAPRDNNRCITHPACKQTAPCLWRVVHRLYAAKALRGQRLAMAAGRKRHAEGYFWVGKVGICTRAPDSLS